MATSYTARQGQFLSFIHGYTVKHGYAPSFENIGDHFGITPPSVNTMIKTLEQRGLLSRLPGVARSLRVLVPATALPSSEFGPHEKSAKSHPTKNAPVPGVTAVDGAATAAIAVLDAVMPRVVAGQTSLNGARVVWEAAQSVYTALHELGFSESESAAVARRVASEAARWESEGRGTVIQKRQWVWR